MAIQLPGTPQQQKAPFSAFDTSSNFKSGLVNVGQAIRQVGAGQRRIKQRQKLEAEEAERDAKAVQAEIDKKEKNNQKLLAMEIEAAHSEQLGRLQTDLALANKIGDRDRAKDLRAKVDALDTNSPSFDLNSFTNSNTPLTDPDLVREATVTIRKSWLTSTTKSRIDQINSENYEKADAFLKQASVGTVDLINGNSSGVDNETLVNTVNELIENPLHSVIRESTGLGTPRAAFDTAYKQLAVELMLNQYDHDDLLTVDELNSRKAITDQIITDKKFSDANIVFTVDDEKAIDIAYRKKLDQVSDVNYQRKQAQVASATVSGSLSLLLNADVITPSAMYNAVKPLEAVDESALTKSQLVKHQSQVVLSEMFIEGDEPLAYVILQSMARKPTANKTSLATQLEEMYGDNFVKIGLAPTEQSMLSDWLNKNLSRLRDIGDNPQNLALLSPYHAMLIESAKTDPSARLAAKKEYEKFVSESPDLKGVAPPKFYLNVSQFPTSKMGNETTFLNAVQTNVKTNGAESTLSHASHRLNQGDIGGLELLRFESEKISSETLIKTGNQQKADEAVALLIGNYKSGLEPDRDVDNLVDTIIQQDNRFSRDQAGRVIPLLTLSTLYDDTLDVSRKEFYNIQLRGIIKLNKGALLEDKLVDDPEAQHEFIRELVVANANVYPLVSATETGSLIELPAALNKYVNLDKDNTGFFGRILYPYGKILSDTESLSNVSAIYTGAVIADMVNQFASLDIDEQLRNRIKELGGPDISVTANYVMPGGRIGFALPANGSLSSRSQRRAFINGVLNIKIKGKPLARIVTTSERNPFTGNMQEVAKLMVLNEGGKYEALAKSEDDRTPISVPTSRAIAIVDEVMPTITDVSWIKDPIGTMQQFTGLNTTYWTQLIGMEEGGMHTRAFKKYDEKYANDASLDLNQIDSVTEADERGKLYDSLNMDGQQGGAAEKDFQLENQPFYR